MISLVCLDLDGTLLPPSGPMSQRTIKTVNRAKEKGIHVVIASGRRFGSVVPHAKMLGFDCPIISYSGCWIRYTNADKPIAAYSAPHRPMVKLLQRLRGRVDLAGLYIDDMLYLDNQNEYSARYENRVDLKAKLVPDLADFLEGSGKDPTRLLMILDDPEKLNKLSNELKIEFEGQLNFVKSWATFLEAGPVGVTKGTSLLLLASHLGINLEQAVAFGDQENDLDMFNVCGLSVAMGNAPLDVQEKAHIVAPSNAEDGVAVVLEKILECA